MELLMREWVMERDNRRTLWYSKDPHTGLVTVRTEWHSDAGMALTAEVRKNTPLGFKTRKSKDGFDMHQAAWIPPAVVPQLVEMGILLPGGALVPGADKAFLKWLSQSEQAPFRVNRGRLA